MMTPTSREHKDDGLEKPIDLDDVLANEIGAFGRYQARNVFLLCWPILMSAFLTEFVFSAASIPHRCRISECGESDARSAFRPDWVANAIPAVDGGAGAGLASCSRFTAAGNGTLLACPADLFTDSTTDCRGQFVYARDNTVVYDFNLGCQEWLRVLAGTLNGLGTLLVLPVTGYVSDTFGRKVALLIGAFNMALFGLIRAFSTSYPMYLTLQLLQTTLGAGTFSCAYVLACELVGIIARSHHRVLFSAISGSVFATGHMILGGVSWLIPSWRYMIAVLHIPCFIILLYYWALDDSVRWQLSRQKYAEAKLTLQKVAKVNKKQLSEKSMNALFSAPIPLKSSAHSKKFSSIGGILRSPVLLRRVVTTPVWWFTTVLVYYGLIINATSLSATMHLNYILTAAIEIPGHIGVVLLLDRVGRKPTLCGGFLFTAACNISFVFISQELTSVRLLVYMLGKSGITLVLTSLYVYTSELYPTEYRHSLLAFSSMFGRVGSVIAPLTPVFTEHWEDAPSLIFGALAILSGLLVFTQPETLGNKMPDTLAEAEVLGKSSSV